MSVICNCLFRLALWFSQHLPQNVMRVSGAQCLPLPPLGTTIARKPQPLMRAHASASRAGLCGNRSERESVTTNDLTPQPCSAYYHRFSKCLRPPSEAKRQNPPPLQVNEAQAASGQSLEAPPARQQQELDSGRASGDQRAARSQPELDQARQTLLAYHGGPAGASQTFAARNERLRGPWLSDH
jgi:hypothetical protein